MCFVHLKPAGVVWFGKHLGSQVKNVSSRYSAVDFNGTRVMGFNNIELICDRPLDINLKEIAECIKLFPDRAMIVSLMADNDRKSWHELIKKVEDTGAHGLELNFGCPHGMTERGMGAAVGQDPEIAMHGGGMGDGSSNNSGYYQTYSQCTFSGTNRKICGGSRHQCIVIDQYHSICNRY